MNMRIFICLLLALATLVSLALVYAQDTITLQDRARISGNYVSYAPPSIVSSYADLNQLAAASRTIVVGVAGQNRTKLTADGNFINIVYDVTIQEVLKGSRGLINSVIKVSVPGGKVAFKGADGQLYYAEIRTPWFKKMESGKQYYLFLLPSTEVSTDGTNYFQVAGGPQGVFEVSNLIVKSNSGRLRDPIWQYHNMDKDRFKNLILLSVQTTDPPLPLPSPTR
jgi:hypothetical protein